MFVLSLKLALENLRQRLFLRAVVVSTSACLLLLIGVLLSGSKSLERTLNSITSEQIVHAFIENNLNENSEKNVISAIQKLPKVQAVEVIGKEEFATNISKIFPELDITALDNDAIPRFLKIKTAQTDIEQTVKQLEKIAGIESVHSNKKRYSGLLGAISTLKNLVTLLLIGVAVAFFALLFNHLKSANQFRSQLAKTLVSLGGNKKYLMFPIIVEAFVEAILASVLAISGLWFFETRLQFHLKQFYQKLGYSPFQVHFNDQALTIFGFAMAIAIFVSLVNIVMTGVVVRGKR